MVTHSPKQEKLDRWSASVVDPTVMAVKAPAGDKLQASSLLLPAATETGIPAAVIRSMAWSTVAEDGPPIDIEATIAMAGSATFCAATQSIPAMTSSQVPVPSARRIWTATMVTALATPQVAPPTVPAQCVPEAPN